MSLSYVATMRQFINNIILKIPNTQNGRAHCLLQILVYTGTRGRPLGGSMWCGRVHTRLIASYGDYRKASYVEKHILLCYEFHFRQILSHLRKAIEIVVSHPCV